MEFWFESTILGVQKPKTIQDQVYEETPPEENTQSREQHEFNKGSVFRRLRPEEETNEEENEEEEPPF